MTDGMTLEEFSMKYPIHRRFNGKILSYEYSYELRTSKLISIEAEAALPPREKRFHLKAVVEELIFELETLIKKAREDFERIE
jgi:hypothetical protein